MRKNAPRAPRTDDQHQRAPRRAAGPGRNRSRSCVQPDGEPLPEMNSTHGGHRRGERLQRAASGQLGHQLAARRSRSPRARRRSRSQSPPQESGVHQHVVGEENRPRPRGEVAHDRMRQMRRAEARRGQRVGDQTDQEPRQAPAPGRCRIAKSIRPISRKSGLTRASQSRGRT